MVDCIIIGSGVAGISAALTLKRRGADFLWLGTKDLSRKIAAAERIANYPGLPDIRGEELRAALLKQIAAAGLEIFERRATGVYRTEGGFTVLCDGEEYRARTVILASGAEAENPIKGEAEMLGRGVSYCATCDGALYKNKTIAIVAAAENVQGETDFLASLAKKVYLFSRGDLHIPDNAERLAGFPTQVRGGDRVEELVFSGGTRKVDGVFFLKECAPAAALVPEAKRDGRFIGVNRAMETSLAGLFAAGDITGRPFQYAKAAGEGNVAAHSVLDFLQTQKTGR